MMTSILTSNDSHIDRAFEMVQRRGRRKVALFGLAFQPGTDDLRESPFVSLAERPIGKRFDVAIFDRSVDLARLPAPNPESTESTAPPPDRPTRQSKERKQ